MMIRFLALGILCTMQPLAWADSATGARAMIATVHPLATEAGLTAMRDGGNAVDGAVAAALTLGVVDGFNSGLGGGCFILIRTADGKFHAIDGRETAPAAATRDMFVRNGQPQIEWSKFGPLASGVPGALAAYDSAIAEHGRRKLPDLLRPAAEIAQKGFTLDENYARRLASSAERLAKFEASRAAFLKPDGSPYHAGETLQQPDLARSYRALAEHGPDWFYRGPFAQKTAAWMRENGGIITEQDFAEYRPRKRTPVITEYRDYTIVGFPPPSSGGVHVAQILNILESFDLRQLRDHDPATFIHVTAEAMKLAFADRAYWLGDPDFADVPRGLIDQPYADALAKKIDLTAAAHVPHYGTPAGAAEDVFKHTTHVAAADAQGNCVAITATINTTFGSKVVVPGTGIVLNNEMDDFAIMAGVPNAFGLVGAEANAVAPGKRPLSSMSPTLVLHDGRPVMTVGAAGGPKIITQAVLAIVNHVDLGMSLPDAVATPRFHHQWSPDELVVEHTMDDALLPRLRRLGHKVREESSAGVTQAIAVTPEGKLIGVADPRVPGKAAGY
jgi:gamma-glutamyltranspeptidase/glutathione hydrolase